MLDVRNPDIDIRGSISEILEAFGSSSIDKILLFGVFTVSVVEDGIDGLVGFLTDEIMARRIDRKYLFLDITSVKEQTKT